MTGLRAGAGGTGLFEGSRPGTGNPGLSPYDQAVRALGPTVYFQEMRLGAYTPPETYAEVMARLGPTVYFDDFPLGPVTPYVPYNDQIAALGATVYFDAFEMV